MLFSQIIDRNMKKYTLLVAFTLIFPVLSTPIGSEAGATILSYDYQLKDDGYFFTYSTSNGIIRQENGTLKAEYDSSHEKDQTLLVNGYYSYKDENNKIHRVDYISDKNGYRILDRRPPSRQFQPKSFSDTGGIFSSEKEYSPQAQKKISSAALASLSGK